MYSVITIISGVTKVIADNMGLNQAFAMKKFCNIMLSDIGTAIILDEQGNEVMSDEKNRESNVLSYGSDDVCSADMSVQGDNCNTCS